MIVRSENHIRSKLDPQGPSPAAIRRQTAAIQKRWSYRTRLKRAGYLHDGVGLVEIPSVPRRKGYRVE